MQPRSLVIRCAALFIALLLLNSALTFQNIWPTLAVRWKAELSIELVALILIVSVWRPATRRTLALISVLFTVLVIGRYADVTAPALYGRPINLYWDAPHVSAVLAMLARAATTWLVISVCAVLVIVLAALYVSIRWSVGKIADAMRSSTTRYAFGGMATLMLVVFCAQRVSTAVPAQPRFAIPVSSVYATQLSLVLAGVSASNSAAAFANATSLPANVALLAKSDVYLVFLESYGSATYDRAPIAQALIPSRERLTNAIHASGRAVSSAFVTSPTFGGSSWLAHLSLLTGIEVRDPQQYERLMTGQRQTFASLLQRVGYRTVALMPGLRQSWPEGSFYRFDTIYGVAELDYRGPQFGWFGIPDQFALAKLDDLESKHTARSPLFVFFPTISTHMPFRPTAPYQPDWSRVLSAQPFDADVQADALARTPQWTDMGASYAEAVAYSFDTIGGYLNQHRDRDFVMIVLGDHQPAASVSGEGASWDVPVHVIASPQRLNALQADGFTPGLTPKRKSIGRMHELAPLLLRALSEAPATQATPCVSEPVVRKRLRACAAQTTE